MSKRAKRHLIKSAFAGLFLGLGVSLLLLIFSIWVVKNFTPYYILIGACVVLGLLWGIFGPARRRKAATPASSQPAPVASTSGAGAPAVTPPPATTPPPTTAPAPTVAPPAAPAPEPTPPPEEPGSATPPPSTV